MFNLTLGFFDLVDEGGKKYAPHLVDTVRPEHEDVYEEELSPKAKGNAPTESYANGSPVKNKTAGGKVLHHKTRNTAQEEVLPNFNRDVRTFPVLR
ncbi:hypothetical protein CONPUDRAFT_156789 [Coniophora puteana RWD-64-598 SS2]|uniref:Uncharacterized protein n=1 Tax=Coniophora puteana (strain RWD-64-598) TaxID=741705 RepID=A0A5M3MF73_CONPW|nr:uncharacterized protein CONPUDRAFT_156789 [Coniophora puteana RWD-64-598 SS2]EIW77580.1 hypothetical protein CONPUDRAFT_156789 [Coniophora puteana RWD-64-598 SS2]